MLEYVPEHWRVHRHVRPKYSCDACESLVQANAPSRPIERGYAGPGLLAHVVVSKYCDHLPLYRQSQIYARSGVELDRATLAEWVRTLSALVDPLINALAGYVMSAYKLHADDTPIPVLAPGAGTTRTGRLWSYVRDDQPSGSTDPPAVLFRYSPDRKGERTREHLTNFRGVLQADGYAGFQGLYDRAHPPSVVGLCELWGFAALEALALLAAVLATARLMRPGSRVLTAGAVAGAAAAAMLLVGSILSIRLGLQKQNFSPLVGFSSVPLGVWMLCVSAADWRLGRLPPWLRVVGAILGAALMILPAVPPLRLLTVLGLPWWIGLGVVLLRPARSTPG